MVTSLKRAMRTLKIGGAGQYTEYGVHLQYMRTVQTWNYCNNARPPYSLLVFIPSFPYLFFGRKSEVFIFLKVGPCLVVLP